MSGNSGKKTYPQDGEGSEQALIVKKLVEKAKQEKGLNIQTQKDLLPIIIRTMGKERA